MIVAVQIFELLKEAAMFSCRVRLCMKLSVCNTQIMVELFVGASP